MNCWSGVCTKCHGIKKLALGGLLLLNAFVWPRWLGIDGWISFVALLMLVGGVLMLLKPTCGHCAMAAMPAAKKLEKLGKKKKK